MHQIVVFLSAIFLSLNLGFAKVQKASDITHQMSMDIAQSEILWEGCKKSNFIGGTMSLLAGGKCHNGSMKFKKANLKLENGMLKRGSVVIDMDSILVLDLDAKTNKKSHDKLMAHLRNEDFFNVSAHKEATFKITEATLQKNKTYKVSGVLELVKNRAEIKDIVFNLSPAGKDQVRAKASFYIDRKKWKVGQEGFMNKAAINPNFKIDLNLVFKKTEVK